MRHALLLLLALAPAAASALPGDLAPVKPADAPPAAPAPGGAPPTLAPPPPRAAPPATAPPAAAADDDDEDDRDDDEGPPEAPHGAVYVFLFEALSGGVHWFGGALVGSLVSDLGLAAGRRDREPLRSGVGLAVGPFAAGFGASWVGEYNDRPGSFWAATGGGALGEAAGFLPMALAAPDSPWLLRMMPPAILAGLGAAAGTALTASEPPPFESGPGLSRFSVEAAPGSVALSLSGQF